MWDKTQAPEGWELRRVDSLVEQLAEVRGDLEPEPIVLSCSKDLGLVPQTELFKRRLASTDTRRYKIVHPGDFVYDPNLLWSGAITRSREHASGIVSPIYEVFRAARGCSRDFLFAWLTSPSRLPAYRAISMGTNVRRRRAGFDDFSKLPIQLPPLSEQRAIAAVLDSIYEAIERTEAVIAATERLRDALLHDLLTRGVPGWHTQWKDVPDLGTIPASWEVVRLREILESTTYGTNEPLSTRGEIVVLRMNNLQNGEIDLSEVRRADLSKKEVHELDLVPGDILFNRTNSLDLVGKVGVVRNLPEVISFASYLIRLRTVASRANSLWLTALLWSPNCQSRIRKFATPGVSQANINPTSLGSLTIPLPPLLEQEATAKLLDGVNVTLAAARREREGLQLLKQSTADALLTGQVRVEMGERIHDQ